MDNQAWGLGGNPVSILTEPPESEPLTLAEGKLRAGLDWADGDPRDDLMKGFIATARARVETDAAVALLSQTREIFYDWIPDVLQLLVRPIQTITITAVLADGSEQVLDPSTYVVDKAGGRIGFLSEPSIALRAFQPWVVDVVAGWPDVAHIPPELLQVVGLLVAHYATSGRDILAVGHIVADMPYGYEDLIAPWRLEVLP